MATMEPDDQKKVEAIKGLVDDLTDLSNKSSIGLSLEQQFMLAQIKGGVDKMFTLVLKDGEEKPETVTIKVADYEQCREDVKAMMGYMYSQMIIRKNLADKMVKDTLPVFNTP